MSEDCREKDYNEKLAEDYEEIRDKVERGMLPMIARLPAIDKAVSNYAMARDEHLAGKTNPPIAYRDSQALDKFADLILYEELKWSHPDKMTIVEYPVMSDRQEKSYYEDHSHRGDLQFGDMRYLGKRKVISENKDDAHVIKHNHILDAGNTDIDEVIRLIDVENALNYAELTDRQREAVALVFFGNEGEGMSHERAGEIMGVSRRAVGFFISAALAKIERYFTDDTTGNDD